MTDEIRKKHEKVKEFWGPDYYSKVRSDLTISDVDALFAALDGAKNSAVKCETCSLNLSLKKTVVALDETRWKVERALKIASMRSRYPAWNTNYYLEHVEEIEQILKGDGDE